MHLASVRKPPTRLLEIRVVSGEGIEFIAHVMPARDQFLR
jgi:hypothetical protein